MQGCKDSWSTQINHRLNSEPLLYLMRDDSVMMPSFLPFILFFLKCGTIRVYDFDLAPMPCTHDPWLP
jgi:hypothetical protein